VENQSVESVGKVGQHDSGLRMGKAMVQMNRP